MDNELVNATKKSVPKFDIKGDYTAKCVSVYDGDTVQLVIRFRGELTRFSCRMLGYNTAEIRTKDVDEKKEGMKAKHVLEELLLDKIITATFHGADKYGRLLVDINMKNNETDINICKYMISGGYAAEYYGVGEKKY